VLRRVGLQGTLGMLISLFFRFFCRVSYHHKKNEDVSFF
jgi:hypothetical protein